MHTRDRSSLSVPPTGSVARRLLPTLARRCKPRRPSCLGSASRAPTRHVRCSWPPRSASTSRRKRARRAWRFDRWTGRVTREHQLGESTGTEKARGSRHRAQRSSQSPCWGMRRSTALHARQIGGPGHTGSCRPAAGSGQGARLHLRGAGRVPRVPHAHLAHTYHGMPLARSIGAMTAAKAQTLHTPQLYISLEC